METPDDLQTLEMLLDKLEVECIGDDMEGEAYPCFWERIMDKMREALVVEVAENCLSIQAFIQEMRTSLHHVYGQLKDSSDDDFAKDENTLDNQVEEYDHDLGRPFCLPG